MDGGVKVGVFCHRGHRGRGAELLDHTPSALLPPGRQARPGQVGWTQRSKQAGPAKDTLSANLASTSLTLSASWV